MTIQDIFRLADSLMLLNLPHDTQVMLSIQDDNETTYSCPTVLGLTAVNMSDYVSNGSGQVIMINLDEGDCKEDEGESLDPSIVLPPINLN